MTLEEVYSALLFLAATSCSERAMHRVRLIKTRLKYSMSKEWMSSLIVQSTERKSGSQLTMRKLLKGFLKVHKE